MLSATYWCTSLVRLLELIPVEFFTLVYITGKIAGTDSKGTPVTAVTVKPKPNLQPKSKPKPKPKPEPKPKSQKAEVEA